MQDVLDRFKSLAADFGARVDATDDSAWDNQSPCAEWKARDVVGHVVDNLKGLAGAGDGGSSDDLDDPKQAWATTLAATITALEQPGALEKVIESPMGPMPLGDMVGRLICTDILVHTWDLARAVGGDERLNQDAIPMAYSGLKPIDAMLRRPGIFGPKIEAPAGADLQTEFLLFLGRPV